MTSPQPLPGERWFYGIKNSSGYTPCELVTILAYDSHVSTCVVRHSHGALSIVPLAHLHFRDTTPPWWKRAGLFLKFLFTSGS